MPQVCHFGLKKPSNDEKKLAQRVHPGIVNIQQPKSVLKAMKLDKCTVARPPPKNPQEAIFEKTQEVTIKQQSNKSTNQRATQVLAVSCAGS